MIVLCYPKLSINLKMKEIVSHFAKYVESFSCQELKRVIPLLCLYTRAGRQFAELRLETERQLVWFCLKVTKPPTNTSKAHWTCHISFCWLTISLLGAVKLPDNQQRLQEVSALSQELDSHMILHKTKKIFSMSFLKNIFNNQYITCK